MNGFATPIIFPHYANDTDMKTLFPRYPVLIVAVIAVMGCSQGAKKVTVNGTILYKGRPLQSGILRFVGSDGSTYSASSIQTDGKFIMTDVVPGEVKVAVQPAPGGSGSSSGGSAEPDQKATPVNLPDKYRNTETSGLKYTITPDTTELKIDIP